MVTLCLTRVVTVALIAVLARPSHAIFNVYSTFVTGPSSHIPGHPPVTISDDRTTHPPLSKKSYKVGNPGCFYLEQFAPTILVKFSKDALDDRAIGPYCLHFYSDWCDVDDNKIEGDDMWQYQNVRISKKTIFNNIYYYPVDNTYNAAFRWTAGNCSNPSNIVDDKNGDQAFEESKL
ncbi:hypothetical protein BDU57DRAFT_545556 [Ampelomyces quisqualis]|uniref:AA1-like domain-containing protein n=1 Tax=Ampelomyces quisqualis TaxID=50730 RepID=A0A6A5QTG9_AMPQU|nr:hypothetical protein BDU57DRAFT_545556 [Ampelomyces quisqualis]